MSPNLNSGDSNTTLAQQGELLYQQHLRAQIETAENIGKIVVIDLNTRDFEIDRDLVLACHRLRSRRPQAVIWTERIGYDAVYAVGGTLVRTIQ